jgi:hypothetical protein
MRYSQPVRHYSNTQSTKPHVHDGFNDTASIPNVTLSTEAAGFVSEREPPLCNAAEIADASCVLSSDAEASLLKDAAGEPRSFSFLLPVDDTFAVAVYMSRSDSSGLTGEHAHTLSTNTRRLAS